MRHRIHRLLCLSLAFAIACPVLPVPVLAQTLPDLGDSALATLTPQLERQIGESIMREYRRDPDFVGDAEITAYINTVGRRLVAASVEAGREFEFFVVRDPSINAFAMPGGFVGVHTGLIVAAQSEAELAGVLAHEVSHVTQRHIARQVDKGQKMQWAAIAGMIAGILAARSNPQAAQAAIVGSQAGMIQAQLNYSRDFEREADRVGFTLMEAAGFDPAGMPAFFDRLQKASRYAEAPVLAYLRTHPLTVERLSDMQARTATVAYRQRPDSIEFQLVRARLRAEAGVPADAVALFERQLREGRVLSVTSASYGLAIARLRARDIDKAAAALAEARLRGGPHPMFDTLEARILAERGDRAGATARIEAAIRTWGERDYLLRAHAAALQAQGRHAEVVAKLDVLVRANPHDASAWQVLAASHAALGHVAWQHRAQGEFYALAGSLSDAVQQLQFAQRARDGDFYLMSAVDARLRELRALDAEERAARRAF
jgi:predicted Zn-dependent protease